MSEDDYHGVKSLVSLISTGPLAELTTLVDCVTAQANIGCIVTTEGGDSGVCAFGTIVNIAQHKANPGIVAVYNLLKDIAKRSPKSTRAITNILTNPEFVTGLFLKERLINFPFELAPNIHKILIDDVKWSSSDEYEPDSGESRNDYKFTTLIFLSTFEVEASTKVSESKVPEGEQQEPAESVGMGHKKMRKMEKKAAQSSRLYLHWEDEILIEKALFSHTWQNTAKPVVVRSNRKYQSYSILYALKWSDYVELVNSVANAA